MSAFGQQNQRIHKTPIGYIDSAYLDGNDGSNIVPVWAANGYPSLSLTVGTAFSIDLAAAGLFTDPGSPTSSLGFYGVSGQDPGSAGFVLTGTVLSNADTLATFGSFQLIAVRNGISVLSPILSYAINAPAGTDNVSPTVPTGIAVAQGSTVGTIALSFDSPSDIAPSSVSASGSSHVDALVAGSVAAPPSPIGTPANALVAPSSVNIGSITNPQTPSFNQTGKQWTLSGAGTGIAATTAEQCLLADFGSFSGAYRIIAKLSNYTSTSATALMGLMLHETAVAGGKFLAIGLRPSNGTTGLYVESRTASSGTSAQVATQLLDGNGQVIIGPIYVKIERASDNKTLTVSYSLNELGWTLITTQTLAMNAAIHYALFITSQSAGNDATGTISEVSINNAPRLSVIISASTAVQIALRSVDVAGNTSALSTSILGVPKPQQTNSKIQWSPGHWMNNNHMVTQGEAGSGLGSSPVLAEINDINNTVCVGYLLSITWSALDPNANGTLNTTFVDAVISKLQTAYDRAYKVFLILECGAFSQTHPGNTDSSIIPLPIISNVGLYGQSGYRVAGVTTQPVAVSGWWGGDGNGNTYAAAMHRPAIMNKLIGTVQALGAKYNNNQAFDGIVIRENSLYCGALGQNLCPDFNNGAWDTQNRALVNATIAAFPNKNVVYENTFYKGGGGPPTGETYCQNFTAFLMANRCAIGSADVVGHSKIGAGGSWGMDAYFGNSISNSTYTGPDYRAQNAACIIECEGPDYNRYALADLYSAVINDYKAKYVFWTRATAGFPTNALWPQLKTFLAANPLPPASLGYPSNYP